MISPCLPSISQSTRSREVLQAPRLELGEDAVKDVYGAVGAVGAVVVVPRWVCWLWWVYKP